MDQKLMARYIEADMKGLVIQREVLSQSKFIIRVFKIGACLMLFEFSARVFNFPRTADALQLSLVGVLAVSGFLLSRDTHRLIHRLGEQVGCYSELNKTLAEKTEQEVERL